MYEAKYTNLADFFKKHLFHQQPAARNKRSLNTKRIPKLFIEAQPKNGPGGIDSSLCPRDTVPELPSGTRGVFFASTPCLARWGVACTCWCTGWCPSQKHRAQKFYLRMELTHEGIFMNFRFIQILRPVLTAWESFACELRAQPMLSSLIGKLLIISRLKCTCMRRAYMALTWAPYQPYLHHVAASSKPPWIWAPTILSALHKHFPNSALLWWWSRAGHGPYIKLSSASHMAPLLPCIEPK